MIPSMDMFVFWLHQDIRFVQGLFRILSKVLARLHMAKSSTVALDHHHSKSRRRSMRLACLPDLKYLWTWKSDVSCMIPLPGSFSVQMSAVSALDDSSCGAWAKCFQGPCPIRIWSTQMEPPTRCGNIFPIKQNSRNRNIM